MFEVVILAIALSMDALAVSIGLGARHNIYTRSMAIMAGVYFGVFQGGMPLIGYFGGKEIVHWIEGYAHWVAFSLLTIIGVKMVYESLYKDDSADISAITPQTMTVLAIATSIDALAAGFTLPLLEVNPFIACLIIGITTFIFSWLGVFIGSKSGTWLESKAELLGGIILIAIGFKFLYL